MSENTGFGLTPTHSSTLLTKEEVDVLVCHLEEGVTPEESCAREGISFASYLETRKQARAGDAQAIYLNNALTVAMHVPFNEAMEKMCAAGRNDWRMWEKWIKMKFPHMIEKAIVEQSAKESGDQTQVIVVLPDNYRGEKPRTIEIGEDDGSSTD